MSVTPSLESVRMNSAITEHNENTSCELAETSPFYWSESKIKNFGTIVKIKIKRFKIKKNIFI